MTDHQSFDPELLSNGDHRNVIDQYKYWTVEAIQATLKEGAFKYHIAIENYQHDFNMGSIVRNANAFNAAGVHIVGRRKWNHRGAMATEKYLQLFYHKDIGEFIRSVQEYKLTIIGVDNIPGSVLLHQSELPTNSVYVFGQEGPGLSEEMMQYCHKVVAIEQFGSTRSVNVGVASGILMYEWVRRNHLN